jgi:membrane associated rhomboid family serine protease
MGIYDRDYQRSGYYEREPGFHLGGPISLTTKLVIVTCAVYVAQLLTNQWLLSFFSLNPEWFRRPWTAYQLLSYGFLHSQTDLWHIVLNMLGLWMFGREVEAKYGSREFLAFYLSAIVVAGFVWTLFEIPVEGTLPMLGASGGITAIMVVFAMNFPHRTVLFMFFLPMPMWVLAVIMVAMDAMGAVNRSGNVAYTAHLGGAAFGYLYYRYGLRLERLLPSENSLSRLARLRRRPKLRVLDPDADNDSETDLAVDEILRKIQDHGQDSLTRRERRILQKASQKYQKRRQ